MQRIKVCHICAALEGASWMAEQLRELRDRYGYDVYALVQREDSIFAQRLRDAGINCIYLEFGYKTLKDMVLLPLMMVKVARVLRRERFDVVQTHLFSSMVVGRVAAWLADVPIRLAMIASPFHLEARITRYIDWATAWMETGIIASCEKTVKLYEEINVKPERISLVYYGPDERKFNPEEIPPSDIRAEFGWPSDTPVVSLVAYFYPELPKTGWIPEIAHNRAIKGHEEFVEAARIILRKLPNVKFLMVGPGWYDGGTGEKYRQKIIQWVKDLGLEKEIIFTGYRSDVNGILRDVNIAVQAPVIENLGGTVEALLMQRPLVATRVGGIPDTVRDGETGILVEPANPEDLARGILQMLQNPHEAERMAQNGRRLMLERFSLSRTVNDLHELYQQLLLKKRRRGYSLSVSCGRQLVALPVYAYLGFRVIFVEFVLRLYVPIYLRVYVARIKSLLYILYYKMVAALSRLRSCLYRISRKFVGAGYRLRALGASASKHSDREPGELKIDD
jgi:glycosyltransferase involved in cell wall biosynthesis